MKRKRTALLLALAYVAVLMGLLTLQALTIEGSLTKLVANAATLVLVVPCFFLLKTYIRLKEKELENAKHVSHIYEKTQVAGRKEFKEKYRESK